jgi:rhamnosyltransferase
MSTASVIVRARDEAKTIERTLRSLHAQSVRPEIIVVDSGSRDGTLDLARRWSDRLIEIDPGEFSYGRALNIGARAAQAPIHFALSAHCWPERDDWIARSLAHYERPEVAGTNGRNEDPWGAPLRRPYCPTPEAARANPDWGFSNHASSWRGEVWERFPFDEEIHYAEDRKWELRVLDAGWTLVFDPVLYVDVSHRWKTGALNQYRRQRNEARAIGALQRLSRYELRDCIHEWWSGYPRGDHSALFHRLNYRRMASLLGKYAGHRRASGSGP